MGKLLCLGRLLLFTAGWVGIFLATVKLLWWFDPIGGSYWITGFSIVYLAAYPGYLLLNRIVNPPNSIKFIGKYLGACTALIGMLLAVLLSLGYTNHFIRYLPLPAAFYLKLREASFHNRVPVYLSDITLFAWEKACFIEPYTSEEDVQSLMGAEYTLPKINTNDDGISYLLFALPNKQVFPIEVSRSFFDANHLDKCLAYEAAKTYPLIFTRSGGLYPAR